MSEKRFCEVKQPVREAKSEKAVFHRWADGIEYGPRDEALSVPRAVVELEDGTVRSVPVNWITFLDPTILPE